MQQDSSAASLEFTTYSEAIGPIQRSLNHWFNQIHEHRDRNDVDGFRYASERAMEELRSFEATDCEGHSCPEWIKRVLRAGYHYARGELKDALKEDQEAIRFATVPRHVWTSHLNLCNELREVGRTREALEHARKMLEIDDSHPISYLELAQCFASCGLNSDADQIIERLIDIADFSNNTDQLAQVLTYEGELKKLTLPSIERLLAITAKSSLRN